MKLLVIGSGGREHALAWKLAQSPRVQKVYVAPGNAGTAPEPGLENVAHHRHRASWSPSRRRNTIHLTVVGPEAPLAAGMVDAFRAAGLQIFGPTRAAAQLESSKDFAKRFMARHGIPTARLRHLHATRREAHAYVDAAGRADRGQGRRPRRRQGRGGRGDASRRRRPPIDLMLVHEQAGRRRRARGDRGVPRRRGSELHRHERRRARAAARHQPGPQAPAGRRPGPNTGGMGAYSPAPVVTPQLHARVMREIIQPAIAGMADGRHPLHRLSLRRPDDRHGGQSEDAGVQLPPRRPGDAADHAAPEVRPARAVRARAGRHARPAPRPTGTAAPRSAWCSPRPAIRTTPRKGDAHQRPAQGRTRRLPRVPRRHARSTAARRRHQRRARAVRHRARRQRCKMAQRARLRGGRAASASTACSTATTSAIARCATASGNAR